MSDKEYTYYDTIYFDITEFLSEYEKLPCLWDRNHNGFRDRHIRSIAEEILGEKLGIGDLKTLRRKIRSVRGTYNAEIRKIKLSLEDGELYIPKLSWFSLADKFLRVTTDLPADQCIPQDDSEICTPGKKLLEKLPRKKGVTVVLVRAPKEQAEDWVNEMTLQNLEDAAFDIEELEFIDNEKSSFNEDVRDSLSDSAKFDTYDDDSSDLPLKRPSRCSNSPELQPPIRKKAKNTAQSNETETSLSDVLKSLKELQKASENEFTAFGRSVAVQLQNLPIEIALQLQTDIQAHITRMRLDYLKAKTDE